MGKSTINGPFSIAILVYQRVIIPTDELHHFSEGWLNHQPVFYHNFTPDTGSHWEPEEIHELLDTLPAKAAEETQPALRLSDARKFMGDISIVNGAFKPT